MSDMRSDILQRMAHLQELTENRLELVLATLRRVAEGSLPHVPAEDVEIIVEAIDLIEHGRRLANEAMGDLKQAAPRQWSILVQSHEYMTAGMLLGCTRGFLNKASENLPKHERTKATRKRKAEKSASFDQVIRSNILQVIECKYQGLSWPTQWSLAESLSADLRTNRELRNKLRSSGSFKSGGSKGGLSTSAVDRHLAQLFDSAALSRSALIREGGF